MASKRSRSDSAATAGRSGNSVAAGGGSNKRRSGGGGSSNAYNTIGVNTGVGNATTATSSSGGGSGGGGGNNTTSIGIEAILNMHSNDRSLQQDGSSSSLQKRVDFIRRQLDDLSEQQLMRFEFFMRSRFSRQRTKKILAGALGPKHAVVSDEIAIVVGGLTKLFVGELMEIALDVVRERQHDGPVEPEDIEEAYRRMQRSGKIDTTSDKSTLFNSSTALINSNSSSGSSMFDRHISSASQMLFPRNRVSNSSSGSSGSSSSITGRVGGDNYAAATTATTAQSRSRGFLSSEEVHSLEASHCLASDDDDDNNNTVDEDNGTDD